MKFLLRVPQHGYFSLFDRLMFSAGPLAGDTVAGDKATEEPTPAAVTNLLVRPAYSPGSVNLEPPFSFVIMVPRIPRQNLASHPNYSAPNNSHPHQFN